VLNFELWKEAFLILLNPVEFASPAGVFGLKMGDVLKKV
jgi:hypothetical protein